ncbi:putative molybdenum carrier protein [Marinobacter sp. C1S70]|uniref:putative molybdenum carrier protein n=1 Tax=Marinobacter sp. C1S70 TaxID=1396859 RepID=UPI0004B476A9|nr:putative molybdenum carrier protein [Marinobacter sp. C1S70]
MITTDMKQYPIKIISGGQTGADRAALDAAIDRNYPIAGSCPKGRLAEDGAIPERYALTEITGGYRARTRKNVQTGDGTLVFYRDELKGGTALTVSIALKEQKPLKLIDISVVEPALAVEKVREFCIENEVGTLNVAGPRSSQCAGIYPYVFEVISRLLVDASES